jgi:sugar phosphate isomerase/epimerase
LTRRSNFDLCVRPGYAVNPDNASEQLPQAVKQMEHAGLTIPMVTGNFDLLLPDHPTAEPILAAMDRAGVRLIKLGYFHFDPGTQDYWQEVDRIRSALDGWQTLARRYRVKICYHTHSHRCMGLNAAALAHLIQGFDPQHIGAYLDPGHMRAEGEEFRVGVAMVRPYLSIIGLKDFLLTRVEANGHGRAEAQVVPAGKGMVDWTAVFDTLYQSDFIGPLSVHCEYEVAGPQHFFDLLKAEVRFFKQYLEKA